MKRTAKVVLLGGLLVTMSVLLGTTVVFEVITTIQDVENIQSQIDYVDTKGDQGNTLLVLMMTLDSYSVEFSQVCTCSKKRLDNLTYSEPCVLAGQPAPGQLYSWLPNPRGLHDLQPIFYECSGRRDKREVTRISCHHPNVTERPIFVAAFLAMTMTEVIEIVTNPDPTYAFRFYEEYMDNIPMYVVEGGSLNSILLSKNIMQKLHDDVTYLNTFIQPFISRTEGMSENMTEFVVSWETDVYQHSKEIKMGNYMNVVKMAATAALAAERLHAFSTRIAKK
ncbi:uncharacterized protein LOC142344288 isoform X2 [Convolutriloba macropyga]